MIKKIMAFLLVLLVLFSSCSSAFAAKKKDPAPTAEPIPQPTLSPDAPDYDKEHPENLSADQLYALSAVLMTQDKGEVIFEKDADEIRYPASMTKILTVLIALTFADDLNETVVVSENAVNVPADSSTMYLKAGEEIRLIDVIYGTMLLSANDGANVIAEAIAGDIPRFVDLMNTTAQTLGCDHSHFVNPHGYHDDNHYSTARDIAVIAREAMKNETFREIVATTSYQLPRTNKQRSRTITTKTEYMLPGSEDNPNKYYYEFATGIKTGSHSHSGYCFAGSAAKEGVELISVVMFTGRKARWADTIKLMDYGFSQYISVSPVDLYNMHPIQVSTLNYSTSDLENGKITLSCVPKGEDVQIVTTKTDAKRMADNLDRSFNIEFTRGELRAPIQAGEEIATLTYRNEKGIIYEYSLIASRSVEKWENAPRSLDEIIAETNADPNPFPSFSFEFALVLFGPPLLLACAIALLVFYHKKRGAHKMRAPKPVNRYVK